MELFIRLKNGKPFEHPILGDNFREAFPHVDTNNLPDWAARFERVEPPSVGTYEVYEGVVYEWSGSIVKDVHRVRPMTPEEKAAKQESVKASWSETGFPSWTFDEASCSFQPPIPFPQDGEIYRWDEPTQSWKPME